MEVLSMKKRMPAELIGYFFSKPIVLMNRYERWRKVAKMKKCSRDTLKKIEWIIFYETRGGFNASFTCRHFGIPPKTFYKYLNRFDGNPVSLEDRSRAPQHVRQKEITLEEEDRVVLLRRKYMFYGKDKLRDEYNEIYGEDISSWKIGYTIKKHDLYPDPKRTEKQRRKRELSQRKKRITELKKKNGQALGYLIQVDTIVLHLWGLKRYIFTAIDSLGKIAFARCYRNQSSYSAADFLQRLSFLLDGKISNIQTDNGSEFLKYFEQACHELKLDHYFSRARTPKDNCYVEYFNRTLQKEWLNEGNFDPDISVMNKSLTDWLIYYNFQRRHASLDNVLDH
jgi:transposase InsO family protein